MSSVRHSNATEAKDADTPFGDELCELWMASACKVLLVRTVEAVVREGGWRAHRRRF